MVRCPAGHDQTRRNGRSAPEERLRGWERRRDVQRGRAPGATATRTSGPSCSPGSPDSCGATRPLRAFTQEALGAKVGRGRLYLVRLEGAQRAPSMVRAGPPRPRARGPPRRPPRNSGMPPRGGCSQPGAEQSARSTLSRGPTSAAGLRRPDHHGRLVMGCDVPEAPPRYADRPILRPSCRSAEER
jgi:hypothetical protein